MTFKVGDIVQLKSGGPPLTVTEFKTSVKVAWIGEDFTAREAFFPAECLQPCTPLVRTFSVERQYYQPQNPSPPVKFTVSIGEPDEPNSF